MKTVFGCNPASMMLGVTAVIGAGAAWSQEPFPEGSGRDTVFLVCTQCHSLNRIIDADASTEEWEFILYDMISRGAPVHKDDMDELRNYLVENFAEDEAAE